MNEKISKRFMLGMDFRHQSCFLESMTILHYDKYRLNWLVDTEQTYSQTKSARDDKLY
jgi:hypothetical protein